MNRVKCMQQDRIASIVAKDRAKGGLRGDSEQNIMVRECESSHSCLSPCMGLSYDVNDLCFAFIVLNPSF